MEKKRISIEGMTGMTEEKIQSLSTFIYDLKLAYRRLNDKIKKVYCRR
jgi:hypothetical protein